MTGKLAIIRVRGLSGVKKGIADTLMMLRLYRKNNCVVVDDNDNYRGMCNKIKDFVTWGELDGDTMKSLQEKGFKKANIKSEDEKKLNKWVYALQPPRKGYGRKGIKVSFKSGGALGYRGLKINDLIKRMI
ncbi:uL30 family ribosomal protein [Candidatus Woesearchaeota archaeon]|nr:uL30 family ribosomal protein [Candidatus Woesearchaeota archaeon]MBW3021509.1 uL30 family ribosomal protein [Candidatus Woesearchaeota archaeon]